MRWYGWEAVKPKRSIPSPERNCPHAYSACEGPPVRAVSGRGNSAAPWAWDAGSRKRGSWSLKRYLPPKKKGNESLPLLQLRNPSYTAAQSKRRRIRLHCNCWFFVFFLQLHLPYHDRKVSQKATESILGLKFKNFLGACPHTPLDTARFAARALLWVRTYWE